MIVDGFIFFNELDLLEIRLQELAPVVDRFLLIEARETHTLKPKPLYFDENRERFRPFLDRIEHVVVDRFPDRNSFWNAEFWQRDLIGTTFCEMATHDDDLLLFCDADEIPAASAVTQPDL